MRFVLKYIFLSFGATALSKNGKHRPILGMYNFKSKQELCL